jgi:hypothetical protein
MAYEIIVSEPWDFTNGSNDNIISGRIVKQIDENSIIFESDSYIEIKNQKGKFLFLSPRRNNENFDMNELSVNCRIMHNNYEDSMSLQQIVNNSTFVIIGLLQKVR